MAEFRILLSNGDYVDVEGANYADKGTLDVYDTNGCEVATFAEGKWAGIVRQPGPVEDVGEKATEEPAAAHELCQLSTNASCFVKNCCRLPGDHPNYPREVVVYEDQLGPAAQAYLDEFLKVSESFIARLVRGD